MKIEKVRRGGMATVRLIGHFQSEHVGELQKQLLGSGTQFVLDLKEVTIVDVDVVRFLGACESKGMKIFNCSRYIREWILREQQRNG
jgi:anti-anti-sigma regulatory factor